MLEVIDGIGTPDEVLHRMVKVVEARRDGLRRPVG